MDRLIITGVDSPIGANLAATLADRWEILGLYDHRAVIHSALDTAPGCFSHRNELAQTIHDFEPDWLIHCGALSASSWDLPGPLDPASMEREFCTLRTLIEATANANCPLAVLSSDAIFSGPWLFHEEEGRTADTQLPAQIRAFENLVVSTDALLVRTHAYGWSPVDEHAGFAQRLWKSLNTSLPHQADGRRYATPILASDLAELLERAYRLKLQGLYHLSGAERSSAFRFAIELGAACGLSVSNVAPSITVSDSLGCEGHDETSLNCRRARRVLEKPLPLLREGLARFAMQQASDWCKQWKLGASERAPAHAA